jgi:hypothetical protein
MEKAYELVFGYGRFKCLGEKTVTIELGDGLFKSVRHFDLAFVDLKLLIERDM